MQAIFSTILDWTEAQKPFAIAQKVPNQELLDVPEIIRGTRTKFFIHYCRDNVCDALQAKTLERFHNVCLCPIAGSKHSSSSVLRKKGKLINIIKGIGNIH